MRKEFKHSNYFVAWVREDNADKPNLPYEAAQKEYMYRVFRDEYGSSKATSITEAMPYDEAQAKKREIWLLTKGELV
jgi:hypothetical protein